MSIAEILKKIFEIQTEIIYDLNVVVASLMLKEQ